jgi:uncharacterized RDD family membrane protein YckC
VGRWTGSWLSGPGSASETPSGPQQEWWGQRLGLPAEGPGAIASFGRRLVAYAVDSVVANLLAALVVPAAEDPTARGLATVGALALMYVVLLALVGQTIGMRLLGLRVTLLADGSPVLGLWRALIRTALLFLLIPALIWDADNRGLHDKAVGTAVLRTG